MVRPGAMVGTGFGALLIVATARAGSATSVGELRGRIAELEGLIQHNGERLQAMGEAAEPAPRRLHFNSTNATTTDKPSIFGNWTDGRRARTWQEETGGALTHLWLILAGVLAFFMQAGFALREAGSSRSMNVQTVLLKNMVDVSVATIGWWVFGWAFAFSGPISSSGYKKNKFIGVEQFAGHEFLATRDDGQQEPTDAMVRWFFNWALTSVATTIVSGSIGERMPLKSYFMYSLFMSSLVYPMVVSVTWGKGFLADMNSVGVFDFAGSGVVHLTGGTAALVATLFVGPRLGRFYRLSVSERVFSWQEGFDHHNVPFIVLGTFVMWFGSYGFNCGSTLSMQDTATGMLAAQVAMNTTLAAATGGLTAFALRGLVVGMKRRRDRKRDAGATYVAERPMESESPLLDLPGTCNGILAGIVSISAACSNVESGSAIAIGAAGGFIFYCVSVMFRICKIDDPVDAIAVHGACGLWGVLAAAFFDMGKGFDSVHGAKGFRCITVGDTDTCQTGIWGDLFMANLLEIGLIIAWSGGMTFAFMTGLRCSKILRYSVLEQDKSLDKALHTPPMAYTLTVELDLPGDAAI